MLVCAFFCYIFKYEYIAKHIFIQVDIYFSSNYIYICILIHNVCCFREEPFRVFFSVVRQKKISQFYYKSIIIFLMMLTNIPGEQTMKADLATVATLFLSSMAAVSTSLLASVAAVAT